MTTATNIQAAVDQANQNEANSKLREAIKMTNETHIHGLKSLVSETLRTNRATTIIAGLLMGGMIAAALLLPGNASADTPARPVSDPEAATYIANSMDMDLLDPGFYDAKVLRSVSATSVFDMDLLDPGFYDAKVVRPGTSALGFDMDLLDPGFYDAKVIRSTSPSWESPGFDPYEDVAAKVIRTSSPGNVMDMDLLDPGFYEAKVIRSTSPIWESPGFDPYEDVAAKVIRSGTSALGFDMDLLDPGFYSAKVIRSTSRVWESPGFDPYEDVEATVAVIAPEGDII